MSSLATFFASDLFVHELHMHKDVGLFPKYLGDAYFKRSLLYILNNDKSFDDFIIGNLEVKKMIKNQKKMKKTELFSFWSQLRLAKIAHNEVRNNTDVTHILLFHLSWFSLILSFLLKKNNRHYKIWIKLDMSESTAREIIKSKKITIKYLIRKLLYKIFLSFVDMVSIENRHAFNFLARYLNKQKLVYIPNGMDFQVIKENYHKEKWMISVGRIGAGQKNSELLLKVAESVNWRDWKLLFIGPIDCTNNFQAKIDNFFIKNPHLRDIVIFTGNVTDDGILHSYYAKAKVFLFPSRDEASALAPLEAASFSDYIISTEVGSIYDLTIGGKLASICPESRYYEQNDEKIFLYFKQQIEAIINNNLDYEKKGKELQKYVTRNFSFNKILSKKSIIRWVDNA